MLQALPGRQKMQVNPLPKSLASSVWEYSKVRAPPEMTPNCTALLKKRTPTLKGPPIETALCGPGSLQASAIRASSFFYILCRFYCQYFCWAQWAKQYFPLGVPMALPSFILVAHVGVWPPWVKPSSPLIRTRYNRSNPPVRSFGPGSCESTRLIRKWWRSNPQFGITSTWVCS